MNKFIFYISKIYKCFSSIIKKTPNKEHENSTRDRLLNKLSRMNIRYEVPLLLLESKSKLYLELSSVLPEITKWFFLSRLEKYYEYINIFSIQYENILLEIKFNYILLTKYKSTRNFNNKKLINYDGLDIFELYIKQSIIILKKKHLI